MAKTVQLKTVISAEDKTKTSLKAATAGFEKFARTAKSSASGIASQFKKANRAMAPLKGNIKATNSLMGALKNSISVMGMYNMAKKINQGVLSFAAINDELSKNSRLLGISAESMQGLNYAAERQGVSTQTLYSSLKVFSRTIGDMRTGQSSLAKTLEKTNPGLAKQLMLAKSNEEAFMLTANAINTIPNASERAALSQKLFGRQGVELNKMFAAGTGEIKKLMAEKMRYGVVTTAQAQKAEDFQDALTKSKTAMQGAANILFANLLPAFLSLLSTFNNIIQKNQGLIHTLAVVAAWLIKLSPVILGVVAAFKAWKIVSTFPVMFSAVVGIFPAVIGAVKAFTISTWAMNAALWANPVALIVLGIVAAIAVVVGVIIILYKKFEGVRNVIKSIGRAVKDFLMAPFNLVMKSVEKLKAGWQMIKKWTGFGKTDEAVEKELEAPEVVESTPLQAQEQESMLIKSHAENKIQTQIDVNFNNLPKGVLIRQAQPVPGVNLNLGYAGT